MLRVRNASPSDLSDIVRIHQEAFANSFLSQLGPAFLELYYSIVLKYQDHIFLVIADDEAVLGFVSGFLEPARFYKLMEGRSWRFALTVLQRIIRKPTLVWPVLNGSRRVIRIASTIKGCGACELSSLAVTPHAAGRGLGIALTNAFLTCAWARDAKCVRLTTDACNTRANELYQRVGFQLRLQVARGRGRLMNEYTITPDGGPACANLERCPFKNWRDY